MYGYPGQQPPQQPQQPAGGYPGYPAMQAPPQQGGYGVPMGGPQPGGGGGGLPYGLAPPTQPAMPYGGNAMGQPMMQQPQGMGMPMQQPGMSMMQQQHPGMMPMQPQQQQMAPMPMSMGYPAAMMQPQPQMGAYPGAAAGAGGRGQEEIVTMQFSGKKLENKDNFSRSDPYYIISKTMGSGHFAEVVRSNVINDSLNPSWDPITIPVSELCNGDYDRQLKITVMDHDSQSHDMIGSFTTTLNMLKATGTGMSGMPFTLVNPKKQNRMFYKNSGTMHLGQFSIQKKSF